VIQFTVYELAYFPIGLVEDSCQVKVGFFFLGVYLMQNPFEKFGLQKQFLDAIQKLDYQQPTPIQEQAIPAMLAGKNVLGQAQTGTGKTAAFALPILEHLQPGCKHIQALVLAPTRELAIQDSAAFEQLSGNSPVRVLPVYGGQSYTIQTRQLKRGVDVVVGTPGRIIDLIHQGELDLSHVHSLVLDEADRMLEMGFIEDVDTIMAEIPGERQIALFSATMPKVIRKLAEKHMSNIFEIKVSPRELSVEEIEQRYYMVREENKKAALLRLLEMEEITSALIFTRTKLRAQELSDTLTPLGFHVESLHGDLSQAQRESALKHFRDGKVSILIATDVAARGLDIENVSHVINFDIPANAEDYVHRIGRTGRAGRKGIALSFITPGERSRFMQFENFTHQSVHSANLPTREDVLAKREEQFFARLTAQLGKGKISNERSLIARLEETSFDLVEIAAAAIQLARQLESPLPIQEFAEHKDARKSTQKPTRSRYNGEKGPAVQEGGMVRLRMNLGNIHGIRPGDVVGAIASEVGIPGRAIGEISIQKDYTFVDIAEKHAKAVLKASTGKYALRGKPVTLTKVA
jgi:ATP-dependent RNA helicase DeaD